MEPIKYPSIEQYRNVIKSVKKEFSNPPVIEFEGHVKLHGTNASIMFFEDDAVPQSRNRVLTIEDDNYQFAKFVDDNYISIMESFYGLGLAPVEYPVVFFGEWCGGNIQSNVAISKLDRMFIVFDVKINGKFIDFSEYNFDSFNSVGIYSIHQFPKYNITIDFKHPELEQNNLMKLTEEVEQECPVGKHFGVHGIGEGIVWKPKGEYKGRSTFYFKVKGEKHSVTKVKKLAEVDIEAIKTAKEFIERTVTENRLLQGIEHLKEMGKELSQKSTGDFLRWVVNDINKEESDTIEENNLNKKLVNKDASLMSKRWYFNYLDSLDV